MVSMYYLIYHYWMNNERQKASAIKLSLHQVKLYIMFSVQLNSGKVHPRTDHEGPNGE